MSGAGALDIGAFRLVENLSQAAPNFANDHTGAVATTLSAFLAATAVVVALNRRQAGGEDDVTAVREEVEAMPQ